MRIRQSLTLSVLLLLALGMVPTPAPAQKNPGITPDKGGVVYGDSGESSKRQERTIPAHEWRYPNSGVEPVVRTDRLYQAFPQDNAVYRQGMVVSLGWQPILEKTVTVKRYEIFIANDKGFRQQIRVGEDRPGKPTVALFTPPEPGVYFWQVWVFFINDHSIASTGRHFVVLP